MNHHLSRSNSSSNHNGAAVVSSSAPGAEEQKEKKSHPISSAVLSGASEAEEAPLSETSEEALGKIMRTLNVSG